MDEVVIIHLLCVQYVTVFFLAEVLGIDPIGLEELLVGHAERLTDGLCDELGLWEEGQRGGEPLREEDTWRDDISEWESAWLKSRGQKKVKTIAWADTPYSLLST